MCNKCRQKSTALRVKRSVVERMITRRTDKKYKCSKCNAVVFIPVSQGSPVVL